MKTLSERLANPRNRLARFYDNGGATFDRYTVAFLQPMMGKDGSNLGCYQYVGMSANPFHPQGFGQHGDIRHRPVDAQDGPPPRPGRKNHLGRRIRFADLPEDCRKLVLQDLA